MFYKMRNNFQHYHWGTKDYLPRLLSLENSENKPYAELWMGAHPKAPSEILMDDKWHSLYDVYREKGNSFPYLFKILSIESPLSIQVHPSIPQAIKGFEKEEMQGILLDAAERNYKDRNHKPELIVALSDFWALKGFRSAEEVQNNFQFVPARIKDKWAGMGLKDFFLSLMNLKDDVKKKVLQAYIENPEDSQEAYWVHQLVSLYPGDISALAPLYMNLVYLRPGEALFQADGELHAYLKGNGVELMANSDNVLRGGLTLKHIDLQELQTVASFKASEVHILNQPKHFYPSMVQDFELGIWDEVKDLTISIQKGPAILLNMEDEISVFNSQQNSISVGQGESLFIDTDTKEIKISPRGKARFFMARQGKAL